MTGGHIPIPTSSLHGGVGIPQDYKYGPIWGATDPQGLQGHLGGGHQLHYQQSATSTTANQQNNNSFLTAGGRNGYDRLGIAPVTPDHKMQYNMWPRGNGVGAGMIPAGSNPFNNF